MLPFNQGASGGSRDNPVLVWTQHQGIRKIEICDGVSAIIQIIVIPNIISVVFSILVVHN